MKKYKWRIAIISGFLLSRLIVFVSFWRVGVARGGWTNFYNQQVEQIPSILAMRFHEYCDWHPPLYYAFTSAILYVSGNEWLITLAQILLGLWVLFLAHKIARLFFSETVAGFAVLMMALEPLWAWHNILLFSENLSVPLFLLAFYYFLKFIKMGKTNYFYYSAIALGLATLTRPNGLLMALLFILLAYFIFFFKDFLKQGQIINITLKKLTVASLIFAVLFGAIISPWIIRNKIVYDRFTLANVLSTNMYFYNVSYLLSLKRNISYSNAWQWVHEQAYKDLGKNVGDKTDCQVYSKEQLNRQFDYYQAEAKKYILADLGLYMKIHLFKTMPYFLQPGYLDMYSAYTGQATKADFSSALMAGNFQAVKDFFSQLNLQLVLYFLGIVLWGACSFSLFFSLIYSYFKDKGKFIFFFISSAVVVYEALLLSPFISARYRLPVYVIFFVSLVYSFSELPNIFRTLRLFAKKRIRRYPALSRLLKKTYDWRSEKKTWKRIDEFLKKNELPYTKTVPPQYIIGHEPTIRCNLRCKMCYQGKTRALRSDQLSTEQILEIYGKLKGRASEIKLVGGEPMVRQDIGELIAFWDEAGVRVILQSNCTLINKSNIRQLEKHKHLTDILTSLDGPQEVHDAIRGVPGTFDKLEKAMALIRERMPDVPITVFATLLINDNVDKFYELIDTVKSMGLGTVNVLFEQVYSREEIEQTKNKFKLWGWESGVDYRLNTQERNPIFFANLDVVELKKKMAAIRDYGLQQDCFVNFTPFNFYKHLDQYLGKEKIEQVFCLKLLEPELRISQKGDVVWCDIIEKSFGNLLEKTPDEIWLSEEYQNFRKYLSQRSLPTCSRCCKAFYYK